MSTHLSPQQVARPAGLLGVFSDFQRAKDAARKESLARPGVPLGRYTVVIAARLGFSVADADLVPTTRRRDYVCAFHQGRRIAI